MSDQPGTDIIRRTLDTDAENPAIQLVEVVAEIEDADPTELPTMYGCIDGVLDQLFSHPPAPEAQIQTQFSYGAYRITVEQNGTAKFVKTE